MRALLALPLLLAASLATSAAPARDAKVRIGGLTLHAVALDEGTVRSTLGEELDQVAMPRHAKHAAVLSISVAKAARTDGAIEYVVSAVVDDANGGSVLGMVEGHALATGTHSSSVERSVLRSAAHGALGQLPSVLR